MNWNLTFCLFIDYYIGIPFLTTVLLIYTPTFLDGSERNGTRKPVLKSSKYWDIIRDYFSLKIIKTCDLGEINYLFITHPHAVLPFASTVAFGQTECENSFQSLFPHLDVRFLAASFCFNTPIYRDLMLYSGCFEADYETGSELLSKGFSVSLFPGGAQEALYSRPEKDIIILKSRTGFIKLAMKNGTSIVPCFCFNEANGWNISERKIYLWDLFRDTFKQLTGISIPNVSNILPLKSPCTLVIGSPIKIPKNENPKHEEVQKYLDIYIESIQYLHNEYSKIYSIPSGKILEIL